MIPFPFVENRFYFFVADHLLVGQLYTNPKSDRSLLLSDIETMFNEQDRRCTAVQLMLSTDPSYDNRTIASTLKMQMRTVQRAQGDETKLPATVMIFGVVSSEGHIMPHHIFEVSLKVNTKVYLDVLKSVVIPWCNQVAGGRPRTRRGPTSPKRPKLGFRRSATTLYPSLTGPLPRPEPAGLLRLVIRREHHQHDLPQHQSQPDRLHPLGIRRAPAGACGKGMLPAPDPYRGGDWAWRRLHCIDVSSTT